MSKRGKQTFTVILVTLDCFKRLFMSFFNSSGLYGRLTSDPELGRHSLSLTPKRVMKMWLDYISRCIIAKWTPMIRSVTYLVNSFRKGFYLGRATNLKRQRTKCENQKEAPPSRPLGERTTGVGRHILALPVRRTFPQTNDSSSQTPLILVWWICRTSITLDPTGRQTFNLSFTNKNDMATRRSKIDFEIVSDQVNFVTKIPFFLCKV